MKHFFFFFFGSPFRTEEFDHSPFFNEQLTAFEVWLEQAVVNKKPPPQLPIVLQVLLSQSHRNRALQLLAQFLEFGPWAVNLALSVGLFPYILKLLQSPATELRKLLVHIWAKIICVDRSCQADLIKDNGYKYFILVIWNSAPKSDERALAACVVANLCADFRAGQEVCFKSSVLAHCCIHLNDPDPVLRQWLCLCLAELWNGYSDAKHAAYRFTFFFSRFFFLFFSFFLLISFPCPSSAIMPMKDYNPCSLILFLRSAPPQSTPSAA